MTDDILKALPAWRGHFLLESGYHTDLWFTLDALFVAPHDMAQQVSALAELLRPYSISAVCGPLLGGAFLAHAVAAHLSLRFYFSRRCPPRLKAVSSPRNTGYHQNCAEGSVTNASQS